MSLAENVARMEVLFDTCADIKKKQMNLGVHKDVPCYLTFIEVAVDMGNSALLELLKIPAGSGKGRNLCRAFQKCAWHFGRHLF